MSITCNLYSQWINAMRSELSKAGVDHSSFSDQDCAIKCHSWKRRIVPAGKRHILKAVEFKCAPEQQRGLGALEKAFSQGCEIWPWQSKFVNHPSYEDGLYNDYRIVHFHLGEEFDSTGFRTRTGELLFAVVDSQNVYEVGIYRHGDWYELDLLDIIDENWPDFLKGVTLEGVDDLPNCVKTREEVKKLRQANICTIMKLRSGRIIAPPGGGIASDGTSIEAVRAAIYWTKVLQNGENLIVASIREDVQNGSLPDKDYEVSLYMNKDEISGVAGNMKWVLWRREMRG